MSGVFQGRSLLVIGASSGIGAELTRQLLEQGARVIAWGRRNPGDEQAMPGLTFAAWDVLSGEDPPVASLPEALHGLVYLPGSMPLKPRIILASPPFCIRFIMVCICSNCASRRLTS